MINCTPKLGGQFELESGGQFTPKLVVNLHWNRMVNLTGFSTEADKQITRKVKEAGRLLDIVLLDSLIITPESYYSFADEGAL